MSYYGTSVDAILYIGTATSDPLPAPGADSFTEVPLLGTITPPPHEITSAFFNVLNDTNKRSVGGKKADQNCPGNLVIDWDEAVHTTMFADLQVGGGQKRNWRIIYPDSRQLDFVGFLTQFAEASFDSSTDGEPHRADFNIAIDGAIAVS